MTAFPAVQGAGCLQADAFSWGLTRLNGVTGSGWHDTFVAKQLAKRSKRLGEISGSLEY